jgi:hypothetical protein
MPSLCMQCGEVGHDEDALRGVVTCPPGLRKGHVGQAGCEVIVEIAFTLVDHDYSWHRLYEIGIEAPDA